MVKKNADAPAPDPTPEIPNTDEQDGEPEPAATLADNAKELADLTREIAQAHRVPFAQAFAVVKTTLDYNIAGRSLRLQELSQFNPGFQFGAPPADVETPAEETA